MRAVSGFPNQNNKLASSCTITKKAPQIVQLDGMSMEISVSFATEIMLDNL